MTTLTVLIAAIGTATAAGAAQRPVPSHAVAAPPRPAATEVARVNGTSITSDRLDAAVSALIPMESFHRNVSVDKMAALRQRALQTLVDEELEYQEALRQHVVVTTAETEAAWARTAASYGGVDRFQEVLQQAGTSTATARAEIRRRLAIGKIDEREVAAKCAVSREDAARFFAANPERFVEPERLHILAITVGVDPSGTAAQWSTAKALAQQALLELRAGASFSATALKYSTDPSRSQGGDMGFVHRGSLNERFEQVARTLPAGHVSDVVETLYGYHIIQVSDIRPATNKSFAEVGARLQKDLAASRCAERKDAWVEGLRARATVALAGQAP